jgi:hypothetical protein
MSLDPAQPILSRRGLRVTAIAAAAVAAVIVVQGITTRKMANARLTEWTEDRALPVVAVATPDTRGKRTTIDLPGRLEAYSQAQLFARVSGYIKEWKVDIGTPSKSGNFSPKSTHPTSTSRSCRRKPTSPARKRTPRSPKRPWSEDSR